MQPIEFPGSTMLNPAKGTEARVQPLPRICDGFNTISFWELSEHDIEQLAVNKREGKPVGIWLSVNGGQSQPPVLLSVEEIKPLNPFAYRMLCYRNEIADKYILVWNSLNDMPVPIVEVDNVPYYFTNKNGMKQPPFLPDYELKAGDYYFRYPTFEEAESRRLNILLDIEKANFTKEQADEYMDNSKEMSLLPALVKKLPAGKEEVIC